MEEPMVILAVTVTVVLGVFAVLGTVVGVVLWCIERTRFRAPFVTFIPTLALIGAGVGSWGLGFLVAWSGGPEVYGQAWWAWAFGLPIGGVLGGLFGLRLARSFRRRVESADA